MKAITQVAASSHTGNDLVLPDVFSGSFLFRANIGNLAIRSQSFEELNVVFGLAHFI